MAIALAGLVGTLGAAYMSSQASQDSANTMADASRASSAATSERYNQVRNDLMPYIQQGYGSNAQLAGLTGTGAGGNPLTAFLTKQFAPGDLTQTPGYQFTLDQGLKANYNSYAARGLGSSGAALKGGIRYASGLASQTYNDQLRNDLAQRQATFNMLSGQSTQGLNAATSLTDAGVKSTALSNAALTDASKAEAAGTVGSTNAITGPLNSLSQYAMLYGIDPGLFKSAISGGLNRTPTLGQSVYGQPAAGA